jgi:hypothetical protein
LRAANGHGRSYVGRRVNLELTSPRQRAAVARLLAGLSTQRAALANGRRVETRADALRWLLESLSAEEA